MTDDSHIPARALLAAAARAVTRFGLHSRTTRQLIHAAEDAAATAFAAGHRVRDIHPLKRNEDVMNWRDDARCRDEDPELFFPIGNTGPVLLQIEEAKAVCHGCPVREQCLQFALEDGEDAGVWGGMSEDERRALKRRAARSRLQQRT